jgi:DNA-binding LacI/PurR family transcriptional regulator
MAACDRVLSRKRGRPTAVLSYSDVLLDILMVRAGMQGLSVPEDLSLLGFADAPPHYQLRTMSIMERPTRQMGKAAAEMFLQKRADVGEKLVAVKKEYRLVDAGTLAPPPR